MTQVKICGLSEEATLQAAVAAGAAFVGLVHFAKSPRHVSLAKAAELKKLLPAHVKSVLVVVNPDDALLADIATILAPDYIQLHGDETPTRVAEIRKKYPTQKLIKAISVSTQTDIGRAKDFEPHVEMLLFDALSSPASLSSSTPLAGRTEGGNGYFGAGPNTLWNNEVLENSEAVAEYILAVLNGTVPPPTPPVNGGGEVNAAPQGEGILPGGNGITFDHTLLAGFQSPLSWLLSGGITAENVAIAIAQSGAKIVDVSSGVESARGVKDAAKIKNFIATVLAP